jgi:hypothetical protein
MQSNLNVGRRPGRIMGRVRLISKGGNVVSVGESSVKEPLHAGEVTKESSPVLVEASEKVADVKVQSNGTQANGNMDILAVTAEPVITTEGDRP